MPLAYFVILQTFHNKIDPPNTDRLDAVQQRSNDLDLRPISFLYATYTPAAHKFELFDSYRRIVMQGLLTFAGIDGWCVRDTAVNILVLDMRYRVSQEDWAGHPRNHPRAMLIHRRS